MNSRWCRRSPSGDFLRLAAEKGIVTLKGDRLEKDTARLSPSQSPSPDQWHRTRLENPIAVMANEVEPLSGLIRYLRSFAWMPSFSIKQRIYHRLTKAANQQFNRDGETYCHTPPLTGSGTPEASEAAVDRAIAAVTISPRGSSIA